MSVAGTIAVIEAVNATIVGVVTATMRPAKIEKTYLPLVLTNLSDGVFDHQTPDMPRHYTDYELHFFAAEVALSGIDANYQAAVTLFDAALAVWNAPHITYSLPAPIEQVGDLMRTGHQATHTGIGKLTYAGVDYWGFTLRIPVQEKETL